MQRESTFDAGTNDALSARVNDKAAAARELLANIARDYTPSTFANSLGAEDMVLTDLIYRHDFDIAVFSIDTGRLPDATHALMAAVGDHYGKRPTVLFPRAENIEPLVTRDGVNGFYRSIDARKACCHARKVEPLARALTGKKAWITGLRAAQSTTRSSLARVSWDAANGLVKFNPLADWDETEVWAYLRMHSVPSNALHAQGFPSIGCAPCTRAVAAGEDVRAGRWWWEAPEQKECGLHVVDGRLQRISNYSRGDTAPTDTRALTSNTAQATDARATTIETDFV